MSNSPNGKILLDQLRNNLLDPLARELIAQVKWWHIEGMSKQNSEEYPVAITGRGKPILLLHGFDSSFLEFRRLVPLLQNHHQLIIPDMHGFGFSPRPSSSKYGKDELLKHLGKVLSKLESKSPIGLIGASMGGAVAMELARRHPSSIERVLLLAPAGLTGRPMPVPPILDRLGVWFLSQPKIRKGLCRQAFADPIASVGEPEEQIASAHLNIKGWSQSLAAFARNGGLANCGLPLPNQPFHVIWGEEDRILTGTQKDDSLSLLAPHVEEIPDCGHLPHLDKPEVVAKRWLEGFPANG